MQFKTFHSVLSGVIIHFYPKKHHTYCIFFLTKVAVLFSIILYLDKCQYIYKIQFANMLDPMYDAAVETSKKKYHTLHSLKSVNMYTKYDSTRVLCVCLFAYKTIGTAHNIVCLRLTNTYTIHEFNKCTNNQILVVHIFLYLLLYIQV